VRIPTISAINTDELQSIANAINHEFNVDGDSCKLREIALSHFAPRWSIDVFPSALQGNALSCLCGSRVQFSDVYALGNLNLKLGIRGDLQKTIDFPSKALVILGPVQMKILVRVEVSPCRSLCIDRQALDLALAKVQVNRPEVDAAWIEGDLSASFQTLIRKIDLQLHLLLAYTEITSEQRRRRHLDDAWHREGSSLSSCANGAARTTNRHVHPTPAHNDSRKESD
jgi:hypothetical protein